MKIIKIVLTGGPCGGKTTAIKKIQELLNERNVKYISLDETATQIHGYNMPFKPSFIFEFQNIIFNLQHVKEIEASNYAKNDCANNDLFVILHDRGIIDNKAYLNSKDDFKKICSTYNMEEIKILDSYDLVLDLLSTATCKEEAYNLGNKARYESLEEAKKIDSLTTLAWINHRNLKILDSSLSLDEESKLILKYINDTIDNEVYLNKSIFELDDLESDYSIYNDKNSDTIFVTDYYINNSNSNRLCKVSKREYDCNTSYIYTEYEIKDNNIRIILDKQISNNEFYNLIYSKDIYQIINRKEINFIYNRQKYTINFYGEYTTLEIDNNPIKNEIVIPNNLKVISKLDNNMFTNYKKSYKVMKKEKFNGNI